MSTFSSGTFSGTSSNGTSSDNDHIRVTRCSFQRMATWSPSSVTSSFDEEEEEEEEINFDDDDKDNGAPNQVYCNDIDHHHQRKNDFSSLSLSPVSSYSPLSMKDTVATNGNEMKEPKRVEDESIRNDDDAYNRNNTSPFAQYSTETATSIDGSLPQKQQPFFLLDWLEDLIPKHQDPQQLANLLNSPPTKLYPQKTGTTNISRCRSNIYHPTLQTKQEQQLQQQQNQPFCTSPTPHQQSPPQPQPKLSPLQHWLSQWRLSNNHNNNHNNNHRSKSYSTTSKSLPDLFKYHPTMMGVDKSDNSSITSMACSPSSFPSSLPGTPKSSNRRKRHNIMKKRRNQSYSDHQDYDDDDDDDWSIGTTTTTTSSSARSIQPIKLFFEADEDTPNEDKCPHKKNVESLSAVPTTTTTTTSTTATAAAVVTAWKQRRDRRNAQKATQSIWQRSLLLAQSWNEKGLQAAATAVAHHHHQRQESSNDRWLYALECWDYALEIYTALLGSQHVQVANIQNNRGIALSKSQQYTPALEALYVALSIRQTQYKKSYDDDNNNNDHHHHHHSQHGRPCSCCSCLPVAMNNHDQNNNQLSNDDTTISTQSTKANSSTIRTDRKNHQGKIIILDLPDNLDHVNDEDVDKDDTAENDPMLLVVSTLHNIANVHQEMGNYSQALQVLVQAKHTLWYSPSYKQQQRQQQQNQDDEEKQDRDDIFTMFSSTIDSTNTSIRKWHHSARLFAAMGHVYYHADQWKDAKEAYQDALHVYQRLLSLIQQPLLLHHHHHHPSTTTTVQQQQQQLQQEFQAVQADLDELNDQYFLLLRSQDDDNHSSFPAKVDKDTADAVTT